MRITLVALLAACSAALRCTHTARFPLAQRRCSVVADGGAKLATLPSQLGRVASWAGEVVVVKYGGHAMTDPELSKSFAADCALMQSLGVRVVVVHGGGPQINAMLKKLEIKSEFVAGLRVTDSATMDAAEMVLCGSINKQIASSITLAGGRAVGLSGKDDKMVTAKRKMHVEEDGTEVSLGQVGEPGAVRTELLESLLDSGIVLPAMWKTAAQGLRPRRCRPPARPTPPWGTPDQAQGGLLPRLASANRQTCPGWPAPNRPCFRHRCPSSRRLPSAATACPTTSTPTPCPARSPRRSARARCCFSQTWPACSMPRRPTAASCCPRSAWTT